MIQCTSLWAGLDFQLLNLRFPSFKDFLIIYFFEFTSLNTYDFNSDILVYSYIYEEPGIRDNFI